jgi:hypothetical protein
MWQSNEPFGWATYHYGSWDWDRRIGWYWVPGYRWAPAWVVWRTSGDYIGWAPVRARFGWGDRFDWIGFQDRTWWDDWYADARYWCFVPSRHIGSRYVAPVIIDRSRNITIINNTTTVNNITIVNSGTTIVNTGVDQTILAAGGNTPPPVVDVTSVPSPDEVRPDNGDADPGLVEIVQPQIDERPPPVATAPVRDSDPVILADPVAPLPEPVDVPVPEANQAARGMDEAPAPDEVFAAPPSPVEDAIAMPELQPGPDTAYAAEPVPAEAMPGEPLPAEVFTPAEPDFVPQPEPEYAAPAEPEFAPPPEPAYEPPPQEFAPPPEMAPPPPPPPQPAPPPPPAPVQLDANGNPIP